MIWGLEQRNTVKSAVQKEKYGSDLKTVPYFRQSSRKYASISFGVCTL